MTAVLMHPLIYYVEAARSQLGACRPDDPDEADFWDGLTAVATQLRTAASEDGAEAVFFVPDALVRTCKMLHPTVKLHRVTVATERTETHTMPLYAHAEVGVPVAWTRTDAICDEDGRPIGTDEPTVSWSSEPPDEEGWFPLYDHPLEVARDAVQWWADRWSGVDEISEDEAYASATSLVDDIRKNRGITDQNATEVPA